MTKIELWRKNAQMSRAEMSRIMDIPVRTIENWDAGVNTPPGYVERLVVNELMRLTESRLEEKARKAFEKLKSDENGNRPVGAWATITQCGNDEAVETYADMYEAIKNAGNATVAYIACNKTDTGLEAYYMDKKGNVYCDYDYITLEN